MYKTLCVAALLLALFALTSGSKPADASATGLPSPTILAKAKLVNQTAPIPATTIFTPSQDGLYRVSVYMSQTQLGGGYGAWDFNLNWSDNAGTEGATPYELSDNNGFDGHYVNNLNASLPGATILLEAIRGVPVTYSVQALSSPAGSYELYYVVERLE
jgi:hypothetical protein